MRKPTHEALDIAEELLSLKLHPKDTHDESRDRIAEKVDSLLNLQHSITEKGYKLPWIAREMATLPGCPERWVVCDANGHVIAGVSRGMSKEIAILIASAPNAPITKAKLEMSEIDERLTEKRKPLDASAEKQILALKECVKALTQQRDDADTEVYRLAAFLDGICKMVDTTR